MEINKEVSINIEGEQYWTVKQFSNLTGREEGTIRLLITKGNQLRRLKADYFGGKPFIQASEIFDFPFKVTGRSSPLGICIEKYIMKGNRLVMIEEKLDKCR